MDKSNSIIVYLDGLSLLLMTESSEVQFFHNGSTHKLS